MCQAAEFCIATFACCGHNRNSHVLKKDQPDAEKHPAGPHRFNENAYSIMRRWVFWIPSASNVT